MRIEVTGPKQTVESLRDALDRAAVPTEASRHPRDHTEFAYELGEIGTIIGILSFALQLAEYLFALAHTLDKTQTIEVRTALGRATIELRRDVTLEELQKALGRLDQP